MSSSRRDPVGEAALLRAQAERLAAENAALRAGNAGLVAENGRLRTRVAELEGQVAALSEQVATLSRLVFGTSSEKSAGKTATPEDPKQRTGGVDGAGRRRRGQQPGSRGHGRRDYSQLPTREVIHDVPECDRVCPRCGAVYVAFGGETCEQVDWEVRLIRIVHRRPTYRRGCRCPVRGVLSAPPPAKPIPRGRFTAGFLARLVVEKCVLGRPVHRIVAALAFDGLALPEGTVAGVLASVSTLLTPLEAAIRARNAAAAHLHADETGWWVFEEVEGKANHRWWLWVFLGCDTEVFRIERSRSAAVLAEHLGIELTAGTLPEGRTLLVSSDFYTAYQALAGARGGRPALVLGAHPQVLHPGRGRPWRSRRPDGGVV